MTPTNELRARLDELGVEYDAVSKVINDGEGTASYGKEIMTYWKHNGLRYLYKQTTYDSGWSETVFGSEPIFGATPEQAIAATVGKRDIMELFPDWEQVLYSLMSGAVTQDNINKCVHELLEKGPNCGSMVVDE